MKGNILQPLLFAILNNVKDSKGTRLVYTAETGDSILINNVATL